MIDSEYVKGRRFGCDCGDPRHALVVGPFFGDEMDEWELAGEIVTLTLVVEPDGWRQRIKGAAMALAGRRWEMHEVIIDREEWPEFVAHVSAIDAACKRAQDKYRKKTTEAAEPAEPAAAEWSLSAWVEEVAVPLRISDRAECRCPFCGDIWTASPYCCDHFRRTENGMGDDGRAFAVFEGTPSGMTHLWLVEDLQAGPVRIVGVGPEGWRIIQPLSGPARLAHRRDLRRFPYNDVIILSSKNDPLDEDR